MTASDRPRLITAHHVCRAAEAVLRERIPELVDALELTGYAKPASWTHAPRAEAIQKASTPAGAISSPGLVTPPTRNSDGNYDYTWRLVVNVFDRAKGYDATAERARQWAALVRAALAGSTLGRLSDKVQPVSENYDVAPQAGEARTLGGCALGFDVTVRNVIDIAQADTAGPPVVTTHPRVTVRTTTPTSQES